MKGIISLIAALIFLNCAYSAPTRQIIFFGDSLSDNGNLYRISKRIIPKSPPYFEGRFSNGLTWAEHIGIASGWKYQNYAVGGATAVLHMPTRKFVAPTTLYLEIYKYLIDSIFSDRSNNLYFIWIGDNDYDFYDQEEPESWTTRIVDGIISDIKTLINYGARHFVVLNLTDTSRTPFGKMNNDIDKLRYMIALHNRKLAAGLDVLQTAYPEVEIKRIDTYAIFNNILEQPQKYNDEYHLSITDTENACWTGGITLHKLNETLPEFPTASPELIYTARMAETIQAGSICESPNQHLFWDDMHPSAVYHLLLAKIIEETLLEKE